MMIPKASRLIHILRDRDNDFWLEVTSNRFTCMIQDAREAIEDGDLHADWHSFLVEKSEDAESRLINRSKSAIQENWNIRQEMWIYDIEGEKVILRIY